MCGVILSSVVPESIHLTDEVLVGFQEKSLIPIDVLTRVLIAPCAPLIRSALSQPTLEGI